MAALRRMDAPSYGGEWQAEPYGYPPGYGGGQTLPPPASGGGGNMGGGSGTLGRSKGKIMSGGGPGGPNPKSQSKGGPKVNGNNSGGQGGWWPECTCTNREWYDQVTPHLYSARDWGWGWVRGEKAEKTSCCSTSYWTAVYEPRPRNSYQALSPFVHLLNVFPAVWVWEFKRDWSSSFAHIRMQTTHTMTHWSRMDLMQMTNAYRFNTPPVCRQRLVLADAATVVQKMQHFPSLEQQQRWDAHIEPLEPPVLYDVINSM